MVMTSLDTLRPVASRDSSCSTSIAAAASMPASPATNALYSSRATAPPFWTPMFWTNATAVSASPLPDTARNMKAAPRSRSASASASMVAVLGGFSRRPAYPSCSPSCKRSLAAMALSPSGEPVMSNTSRPEKSSFSEMRGMVGAAASMALRAALDDSGESAESASSSSASRCGASGVRSGTTVSASASGRPGASARAALAPDEVPGAVSPEEPNFEPDFFGAMARRRARVCALLGPNNPFPP
mmetsp:Transcript_874/g.2813  ORF Transcript_874/g.2813 Transcript_874/m.2813 type:complete len:243 (+) Transcript_874:411-1139(+)